MSDTPSRHVGSSAILPSQALPALSTMPLDIVVKILLHLDPLDIFALRMVCRNLHLCTQQRALWIRILQRICKRCGVVTGTYPMEQMSLPELEHAASSPFRVPAFLRRELPQKSDVKPLSSTVFQASEHSELQDEPYVRYMELLHGGRFLLTLAGNVTLYLWDLGFRPQSSAQPALLAMHECTSGHEYTHAGTLMDTQVNGASAYILIVRTTNQSLEMAVHQIRPGDPSPRFETLATCSVPDLLDFHMVGFVDNLVSVCLLQTVVVWDWTQDEWIQLDASDQWDFSDLYLHTPYLIAWQGRENSPVPSSLVLWQLPPLLPRMPNHPPSRYLLVPPDFIVPSSTPLRLGAIPLISPLDPSCRHREPSAPPEVLDMYIFGLRKGDEQWECSKYKLYPISHDLGPAASTCVPIRCGSTSFPSATWSRGAAFNTVQLASGDHLALVIDEDDFIGAIMLFSNTDAPVGHVIGRLRIESPSPDMYVSLPDPAFDPVSGRICITDDCASILIMDYLLPRP